MTLDEVQTSAVERLHAQGHLLHSQLRQITGGDEALMCAVRDRLIEGGLVVDKFGVALIAIGDAAIPTADLFSNQAPSQRKTAENLSALVESHATLPVSQDNSVEATGSEQGSLRVQHGAASETPDDGMPHRSTPALRQPRQSSATGGASGGTLRYVLWSGGRELGPFPREELEQRIAEGRLQPTDFVRIDSEEEWIPASKAIARTGPSQSSSSDRKSTTRTPAPVEEIAAATTLAVAVAAAARQAARPKSNPNCRSLAGDETRLPRTDWTWLKRHCTRGRLQNGATILVIVFGLWVYGNWSPATRRIPEEFNRYVSQMEGIEAVHGSNPSSPEWRQFVDSNQPRIKQLVESLKPRANGNYPADRELFYAGEGGLLPMLREGLHGAAHKKYTIHLYKALQILDGTAPANLSHAGSTTNSGSPGSIRPDPAISPGAASSSNIKSSAIPPGTSTTAPYTLPGTPPATPANSHGGPRATR